MGKEARFGELHIDEHNLYTPVGIMPLADITRAEFVRDATVEGASAGTRETSMPAVAGGAVVGGVLFGTVGAVVGGLAGSTVKEDAPGRPHIHTNSVTLEFVTPTLAYSLLVEREDEVDADRFVRAVRRAKRH